MAGPVSRWSLRGAVVALIVAAAGTVLGTGLLLATTYKDFQIPSGAMRPTLPVGSQVLVERGGDVEDGDIVVFRGSAGDEQGLARSNYVKRVIGRGGETVACCSQGAVTRDGVPLAEPYLTAGDDPFAEFPAVTVPRGRLWVMGDNRGNSADSRHHRTDAHQGTIAESDVIGPVVAHGGRFVTYGYVARRAALLSLLSGLLVGLAITLTMRFKGGRAREQGDYQPAAGTMAAP